MKLQELHKLITDAMNQGFGDHTVIKAKDDEGNGFNNIYDLSLMLMDDNMDVFMGDDEDIEEEDYEQVLVLW